MAYARYFKDDFTNAPPSGSRAFGGYPTTPGGANSVTGVGNGWTDLLGGTFYIDGFNVLEGLGSSLSSSSYKTIRLYRPTNETRNSIRAVATVPANDEPVDGVGSYVGLQLLLQPNGDHYLFNTSSQHAYIYKNVGGTVTALTSVAYTLTLSDAFTVTAQADLPSGGTRSLTVTIVDSTTSATVGTVSINDGSILLPGSAALTSWKNSGSQNAFCSSVELLSNDATPSFTASPNAATAGTNLTITLTGVVGATAWTASTVFAISGGTGASITAQSVNATTQVATLTVNPGSTAASLVIADNTDSASASITVTTSGTPSLTLDKSTATAVDGGSTVSITATRSNSTAALTASVARSGGGAAAGTISTASPTSGTAFSYTPPATGSGTDVVTVADATDGLTRTCTITYAPGASLSISPTSFPLGVVTPCTLTGNGTSIGPTTVPTISGGTNAYYSDLAISGQVMTFNLNPGSAAASLSIGESADAGVTAAVSAVAAITANVVYHGDSLTFGVNGSNSGTSNATRLAAAAAGLGPAAQVTNYGNSGHTLVQMTGELGSHVNALYDPTKAFNVLVVQGGHNDLNNGGTGGISAATVESRISTYIGTALAAHPWLIVWATETPAANAVYPANFDVLRDSINSWMRANWRSLGVAALSDVASDFRLGLDGSERNTALYGSDLTHPVDAGYTIWGAQYDLPAIQSAINTGSLASTGSAPTATGYVLRFPPAPVAGQEDTIAVLFNGPLTTATTVTLSDASATFPGGASAIVNAGSSVGFVNWTPTTSGSHALGVSHSGQSGIADPTTGLSSTAAAATSGASPATGFTLVLGATSGVVGSNYEAMVAISGGSTLASNLVVTVSNLAASPFTVTVPVGTTFGVAAFTPASPGTLTPSLSYTGGNAGMTPAVSPSAFAATAPSAGSTVTDSSIQADVLAAINSCLTILAGGVDVNLAQPLGTLRDQTAVTAPTIADALGAAWGDATGPESKPNTPGTTMLTKQYNGGAQLRQFTLDSGTLPTTRT